MERKQAGKVERKTVDAYVRLGTSAWSQSDDDARTLSFARQRRRDCAPGLGGCRRGAGRLGLPPPHLEQPHRVLNPRSVSSASR